LIREGDPPGDPFFRGPGTGGSGGGSRRGLRGSPHPLPNPADSGQFLAGFFRGPGPGSGVRAENFGVRSKFVWLARKVVLTEGLSSESSQCLVHQVVYWHCLLKDSDDIKYNLVVMYELIALDRYHKSVEEHSTLLPEKNLASRSRKTHVM